MRIRDLKRKHGSAIVSVWPPMWSGSYGPGDRFAVGEQGVLQGIRRVGGRLSLTIEYEGRLHHGPLEWTTPPSLADVEDTLRGCIGRPTHEVGEAEVRDSRQEVRTP